MFLIRNKKTGKEVISSNEKSDDFLEGMRKKFWGDCPAEDLEVFVLDEDDHSLRGYINGKKEHDIYAINGKAVKVKRPTRDELVAEIDKKKKAKESKGEPVDLKRIGREAKAELPTTEVEECSMKRLKRWSYDENGKFLGNETE